MQIPSRPELIPPLEPFEEFLDFSVKLSSEKIMSTDEALFKLRLDLRAHKVKDIYFVGIASDSSIPPFKLPSKRNNLPTEDTFDYFD